MESKGHAQPPPDASYKTAGNPVTTDPVEQREAQHRPHGDPVERRLPTDSQLPSAMKEAIPSSLGYGSRGPLEVEERFGITAEKARRCSELNGEKMRPMDEGEVADAVSRKPGASGSQPDLVSDLDRKKQEQASAREGIKEQKGLGQLSDFGDRRDAERESLEEL